jgi:transcription elongation factor GreA
MPEIHYLTAEGLAKLKAEYENLKGAAREDLAKRLRHAIQQGDLSENADYIQAKEEQGFLEGRILELGSILNSYQLIDETTTHRDRVNVGAKVTIRFVGESYEESYQIVGPKEADPSKNRISHASPIGSALMDHAVGDQVQATTPHGKEDIIIVSIE